MFCAVSGVAPENPVVSTKSGHVFEQSVVEKYIESTGKCPVTGEPLEASDLLALKASTAVKPRPVAATSIPGMLTLFQNEWDALMLESFTLKQQLETVRQELGRALYEHDAACRVIARLIKERDDARSALAEARAVAPAAPLDNGAGAAPAPPGASAPMDVEAPSGITPEMQAAFEATAKTLSKGRKKRPVPPGYSDADSVAAYTELASKSVHAAGAVCLDAHSTEALLATGGADGTVAVFSSANGALKAQSTAKKAHAKPVTAVKLHPSRPLVLSASADGSMRIGSAAGKGETVRTMTAHSAGVSGLTLHATGDFAVSTSADRSWALVDLERGATVLRSGNDAGAGAYTCAAFHPDGLILATGMGSVVRVWEVKSQANAATFDGHTGDVTCLSFSENGYYLATGSTDQTVRLWDLRKLANFAQIDAGAPVGAVQFDYSGKLLAVGAAGLSVYETKGWGSHVDFGGQKAPLTGAAWGPLAHSIACSTDAGVVKLYGAK